MRKNRLIYGAVVFVLFIFITLRYSNMTYAAFYAALILPIISFSLAWLSKNKIAISEELSHNFVTKKETVEYKVKIKNRGFLPCFFACLYFDLQDVGLDADVAFEYFSVKPFGSYEALVKLSGKYRGIYEVGIENAIIYDFLGIFKFKLNYTKGLRLTIAPQIIEIPELQLEVIQEGETVVKRYFKGKDYNTISELREYQPMDTYKQIHWKATAKRNELISKDPQEIEQLATVFFLNNERKQKTLEKALEREDKMMDVVVSAMSHCYHLGHRMALQTLRPEYLGAISARYTDFTRNFTHLYHETSILLFGNFGDFNHLLNECLSFGETLENVFIFTQTVDEDLISAIQSYKLLGSKITLFLFGAVTKNAARKLESLELHCIHFD